MMSVESLIEAELVRPDWTHIMEANGPATNIPSALRELVAANTPDEVRQAYWKLENHVVVQGQLFEAAVYVVPVLLAALLDTNRPRFVRIGILELLFQIIAGTSHEDEVRRGFADLGARCKRAAREGLWLLYREFFVGGLAGAKEIIQSIDEDTSRLVFLERHRV